MMSLTDKWRKIRENEKRDTGTNKIVEMLGIIRYVDYRYSGGKRSDSKYAECCGDNEMMDFKKGCSIIYNLLSNRKSLIKSIQSEDAKQVERVVNSINNRCNSNYKFMLHIVNPQAIMVSLVKRQQGSMLSDELSMIMILADEDNIKDKVMYMLWRFMIYKMGDMWMGYRVYENTIKNEIMKIANEW